MRTVTRFNHTNGIDLIGRAHQLVMEGYKWMFNEAGTWTQIFSTLSVLELCYFSWVHGFIMPLG